MSYTKDTIQHVKQQEGGYSVTTTNGVHHSTPENHRLAAEVVAWVDMGNTIEPIETDAERTKRLLAYVNQKREAVKSGGMTWNGYPVDTDKTSRESLITERVSAEAGDRTDGEVWRMADNTDVALTNLELIAMSKAVRDHAKMCYGLSWQIKADIDSGVITSEAEIDAANWPA